MTTQEKAAVRNDILEHTIARWLEVERETIDSTEKIKASTGSLLVKQMMDMIRMDSVKHCTILETIQQIMQGTITMTPEEMGELSELLQKHLQIENESIVLARSALDSTDHMVIKKLLEYLLEDEQKHVTMTEQVQDYKQGLYPYA